MSYHGFYYTYRIIIIIIIIIVIKYLIMYIIYIPDTLQNFGMLWYNLAKERYSQININKYTVYRPSKKKHPDHPCYLPLCHYNIFPLGVTTSRKLQWHQQMPKRSNQRTSLHLLISTPWVHIKTLTNAHFYMHGLVFSELWFINKTSLGKKSWPEKRTKNWEQWYAFYA